MKIEATFFSTAAEFGAWLEKHHETASEVWVGYYKKATGRPTMTWSEAVDEALCFGWIDGKLQRIDDQRHRQRFTPRRPRSNWSAVNVAKVAELRAQGRMRPAGEAAFAARRDDRSAVYSYERRHEAAFDAEQEAAFRGDEAAWSLVRRPVHFLPPAGNVLGRQRQTPRDTGAAPRDAHRVLGRGAPCPGALGRSERVSRRVLSSPSRLQASPQRVR